MARCVVSGRSLPKLFQSPSEMRGIFSPLWPTLAYSIFS